MRKEKQKERALNQEAEVFKRNKLPKKYIANILFRQGNKKFENEYLKKLEKSCERWKEKGRQFTLETEL